MNQWIDAGFPNLFRRNLSLIKSKITLQAVMLIKLLASNFGTEALGAWDLTWKNNLQVFIVL